MPQRIDGNPGVVEQGKEYSGGFGQPSKTIRTWRGTKTAIRAFLKSIIDEGWKYNCKEEGPTAILTAEEPDLPGGDGGATTVLEDNWELLPGEVEKDLLEADLTIVENINPNAVSHYNTEAIRNAIAQNVAPPSFAGSTTNVNNSKIIYYLMHLGVKGRIQFAPRLRHTQTVSRAYTVQAAVTNCGRILTSATLVSSELVPAAFLIALNAAPFSTATVKDMDLPTPNSSGVTVPFANGWLKFYPTLNVSGGGRLQIVQEWAFGTWSTVLYGAAL